MSTISLADRVIGRAARAGCRVAPPLASALAVYIELLTRWNRRINLTSLPLEPSTDEALDRLVVESLVAAPHAGGPGASALDLGSGAGSPAIPLKLARPDLRLVMVEARARKSAFLREAVRTLRLEAAGVATGRLEELVLTPSYQHTFDCVTVRAVRLEDEVLDAIAVVLKPGGVLLSFGARDQSPAPELFTKVMSLRLPGRSLLSVLSPSKAAGRQ